MTDDREGRGIQQLESYEIVQLDEGIRLRLWSDHYGRPVEFNVSPDQITMLALEFKKEDMDDLRELVA